MIINGHLSNCVIIIYKTSLGEGHIGFIFVFSSFGTVLSLLCVT